MLGLNFKPALGLPMSFGTRTKRIGKRTPTHRRHAGWDSTLKMNYVLTGAMAYLVVCYLLVCFPPRPCFRWIGLLPVIISMTHLYLNLTIATSSILTGLCFLVVGMLCITCTTLNRLKSQVTSSNDFTAEVALHAKKSH